MWEWISTKWMIFLEAVWLTGLVLWCYFQIRKLIINDNRVLAQKQDAIIATQHKTIEYINSK